MVATPQFVVGDFGGGPAGAWKRCERVASNDSFRLPAADRAAREHEARGLLNLVGLLSHCLRNAVATQDERRQWRREVEEAAERLESLRRAGVSLDLR